MTMSFDQEGGSAGQAQRGCEPLFYTSVTLDDKKEIPEDEIIEVQIGEFAPPPRGKSEDKDFDLLAHIEILPEKGEGEEDAEELSEDPDAESAEAPIINQLTVPKIQQYWIKLLPG